MALEWLVELVAKFEIGLATAILFFEAPKPGYAMVWYVTEPTVDVSAAVALVDTRWRSRFNASVVVVDSPQSYDGLPRGRWPSENNPCKLDGILHDTWYAGMWYRHVCDVWYFLCDVFCVIFSVWYFLCDIFCVIFALWYFLCDIFCVIFSVWYFLCDIFCVIFSVWYFCVIFAAQYFMWYFTCDILCVILYFVILSAWYFLCNVSCVIFSVWYFVCDFFMCDTLCVIFYVWFFTCVMFDVVVVLLVGWGRPFGNSLVKGVDSPVKGIVPAPTHVVFDIATFCLVPGMLHSLLVVFYVLAYNTVILST